jgi:HEAT repeat protein
VDYSLTFARQFARLVWLLTRQPDAVEEQKGALRAAALASRSGQVILSAVGDELAVGTELVSDASDGASDGVSELAYCLRGHGVKELIVDMGALPSDILGTARVFAAVAPQGDEGRAVDAQLRVLAPRTVRARFNRMSRSSGMIPRITTPLSSVTVTGAPATPNGGPPAPPRAAPSTVRSPTPPFSRPIAPPATMPAGTPAVMPPSIPAASPAASSRAASLVPRTTGTQPRVPTPPATTALPAAIAAGGPDPFAQEFELPAAPAFSHPPVPLHGDRDRVTGLESASVSVRASAFTHDVNSDIVREFTHVDRPRETADEFFSRLDATNSVAATSSLLDQIVLVIEESARDNRAVAAADLFYRIVAREAEKSDPELKRAYASAIRRLSKPTILRGVASILPKRKERAPDYLAILARAGEEGAEALIEQLTAAQSLTDRRVFFSALVTLQAGASTLTYMLGDARWYVARNAADLLGELNAVEAEGPLAELLKHDDDRVRRAATSSLAKLGTSHALLALKRALKDTSPQVRATAAAGLAGSRRNAHGVPSASTLLRALDSESDVEVQLAILSALGRVATSEAVDRLIKAAEPAGGLFKRKATSFRVAAVQALGDARTSAALAALQTLSGDRDRDVRDAAKKALAGVEADEPAPSTPGFGGAVSPP